MTDRCEHHVAMSEFCSDCVGFNPVTASPACDWCADPSCGFCARQGATALVNAPAEDDETPETEETDR